MPDRHEERTRGAHAMPPKAITLTQDDTLTGGLCLGGIAPVSPCRRLEPAAQARAHDPWHGLLEQARAGRHGQGMPSTRDAAPGRLASGDHHLGAHPSPDLCHGQPELRKAVAAPMAAPQRAAHKAVAQAPETRHRGQTHHDNANGEPATRGPGHPPQGAASLEPVAQDVDAARHDPQRRRAPRETVTPRLRASGHASHGVALERGVRRHGPRRAGAIPQPLDPIRSRAQHEPLSAPCLERLEPAAPVVPPMRATIACGSGSGRQQGRPWDAAPRRARAEPRRRPLLAPAGAVGACRPRAPPQLTPKAQTLAEVCQRSSAHGAGRPGALSLRPPARRGLDPPRQRGCRTAVHNLLRPRPDGPTAAARFFGQKPRSMWAAILESVESPPAPLRPPRRAFGSAQRV